MMPADEWLARDPKSVSDAIPYVLAVDTDDKLQRVIVDARLMQSVERCRTFWHRLQEQGGIHNSHADILLAREKVKWEEAKAKELGDLKAAPPVAATASAEVPPAAPEAAAAGTAEPAAPDRNPDVAWIETSRCPSCNECQTINDKMFVYNANKQAYITDVKLGTYRQLVEAAETCQVAIIHPGKPWNPDEPGLEELMTRAEPFR
jgi:ferredoxin